jgi:hypothetical protein
MYVGDAPTAHTHPLSQLTQSGATLNQVPVWNGIQWVAQNQSGGSGSSGEATELSVTQSSHGFSVGNVLKKTGAAYALAQANTAANAEVVGIVSAVADANTFTLLTGGYIDTLTGLTANTTYFLSEATAGILTTTEPATTGSVSKPLLNSVSTTAGVFTNMRGITITGAAAPIASTDEAIARFDGVSGGLQNSTVKITDNGSLVLPENSNPTASGAGEMKLFTRQIANRLMPAFISPSGLDSALQPLLARNKIAYWNPAGNSGIAPGVFGMAAMNIANFTATARSVATTNLFTRMRRLGYVTAATAGTVGNFRQASSQFTVGSSVTNLGGFTYIKRFGISDPAPVADARMFIGLRTPATPANVEPSTLTDCIGIGHGAADTNLFLYYGGSVAQTPINLGANFPANTSNTDVYELALFSAPNSGDVHYEVRRLNTGHVATGTIVNSGATVLPTNTTLLNIWGYRTNNTTALAVGLDVISIYIETDY